MAFFKGLRYFAWITSESSIYGFIHLCLKISLTPHQPTRVFVVFKMHVHYTSSSATGDIPPACWLFCTAREQMWSVLFLNDYLRYRKVNESVIKSFITLMYILDMYFNDQHTVMGFSGLIKCLNMPKSLDRPLQATELLQVWAFIFYCLKTYTLFILVSPSSL